MPHFNLHQPFEPRGDQAQAIGKLVKSLRAGNKHQTLLGVTGSGKTFTMANIIAQLDKPALVISHNKTLAAQLYSELRAFFPDNAVEYFVSYFDYYQPEAYIPRSDTYIEKDSSINDEIERLRLSTMSALLTRQDVIVVASVSCIYGLGSPEDYAQAMFPVRKGNAICLKGICFLRVASLAGSGTGREGVCCSWRELNDFQVEDIRRADEKLEPAQRRFMEGAMLERAEKGELITATKLVELKNGGPVKTSWAPVQPYSLEPRPGWIGWNPENMVPSPEFLQKALKPESYAELMAWAATRKVDGGATVKEWIEGLPQAQRSAAKAAKKVKPAAPRPSAPGVPGLAALPPVEPASADPAKQVAAHVHSGKAPAKVQEAIAEAGRAIAEVQSDGGLLQTEVAARPPGDHYGYYDREQPPAGFGSSMAVSEDCPVIVNDALHECGHKIEEEAIIHHDTPLNAEAAAQRKAIVAALLDTPTAQAIKAGDADDRDYLLDPSEVFARAFAQWVTTRSSSALAKKELADILAGKHTAAGVPPVWQWQADEFFKAIVLFDNLMRALRWSK